MAPPAPRTIDLTDYTAVDRIVFLDSGMDAQAVLTELAAITGTHPDIDDPAAFERAIFEREKVSSTAIGNGIAVPHAKLGSIAGLIITIGISRDGIDFQARDGKNVHVFVMIGASDSERDTYLKVLGTVAARLRDPAIAEKLRDTQDKTEALKLIVS